MTRRPVARSRGQPLHGPSEPKERKESSPGDEQGSLEIDVQKLSDEDQAQNVKEDGVRVVLVTAAEVDDDMAHVEQQQDNDEVEDENTDDQDTYRAYLVFKGLNREPSGGMKDIELVEWVLDSCLGLDPSEYLAYDEQTTRLGKNQQRRKRPPICVKAQSEKKRDDVLSHARENREKLSTQDIWIEPRLSRRQLHELGDKAGKLLRKGWRLDGKVVLLRNGTEWDRYDFLEEA